MFNNQTAFLLPVKRGIFSFGTEYVLKPDWGAEGSD